MAIKVLRSDLARDPSFLARFRREAQSAASLNHPAIVSVYDTGEDIVGAPDGSETQVPFIVMEYVEGHTVRDLLKDGSALPIDEAIEITTGVLAALEYSHKAGIVHRDIKPANVMLTPTGAVKVMDFGIARAMADSSATMTQTQAVVGTAQYLSPEQARGEVVDIRSDLYSTGCLLYELLTGRPPFVGDSAVSVAYQHVGEQPKPPSQVAPDVPEGLDRIVIKALVKDREQRYATAAEFRSDLEAAARDGAIAAPVLAAAAPATQVFNPNRGANAGPLDFDDDDESGAEPEEEPKKSNKALVTILIIVALLAIAGITYLLIDRNNQPEAPPEPELVMVPDLEGMTEDEVRAELDAVGLEPNFDYESNDEVEADLAISWDPETGTEVDPEVDNIVNVLISQGPDSAEIPDVEGLNQSRARDVLDEAGFTNVVTETRNQPRVSSDTAIETEPSAGETQPFDTEITLVLGTGNVELQNMVGDPLTELQEHISELGLSSQLFEEESDGEPGIVVRQSREGTVPQDTTVEIWYSVEAPPEPTPTDTDEEDPPPTDEDEDEPPPDDEDNGGDEEDPPPDDEGDEDEEGNGGN